MKNFDHKIGHKIKAVREIKRLTQEQLAEAAGISTVYLSEIENKRTIPSFSTLYSICLVLNLSLDSLVFDTESDAIKDITRLLSRCNEKQLKVIYSMIEAMLQVEMYE